MQGTIDFGADEQTAALLRIALAGVLENLEQELARQLRGLGVRIGHHRRALAPFIHG